MKFTILHESPNRIRVHMDQERMSFKQADTLQYYLDCSSIVTSAKVYERTADAVIFFKESKEEIINLLRHYHCEEVQVPDIVYENSSRELNSIYQEKLVMRVMIRAVSRLFVPSIIRNAITIVRSAYYIIKGIRCLLKGKIEVSVLDAVSIGVSIFRRDFDTASSIMFLLGIGELLEEWTHKKSVDDLAKTMSLNVNNVWMISDSGEVLMPISKIKVSDKIVVRMGNVIPFDGTVVAGDVMANESSMTGESMPVHKKIDSKVFAGTVLEEGEIHIRVDKTEGDGKYDKIVKMIEETEKLKASVESKAEHLADNLVPFSLIGTLLVYLFTRNTTKALAVLMVDYSCALKLAMPVTVLSAIREAGEHQISVKGGKFLEAIAQADTIVFDKTGTLTRATPKVADVISFGDRSEDELLRIAACMEEHFPHSMAKAVVDAAVKKGLDHEEMHTKVEYIVAHGISTTIEGKSAIIGSYHFVFEDEKCIVAEDKKHLFERLPAEQSHLFLAIEGKLEAVICIEDPLRDEAAEVVKKLKGIGFKKVVMMTGDNDKTAKMIAKEVGVDEYYSEVLPEDKAAFIEREKAEGARVVMVGDGINDSPALSAADVGIAVSDGAQIARQIADITIGSDDLYQIVNLKKLSDGLMKRIKGNYRKIMVFNTALIVLGVAGILPPTTSSLLHNTSTLVIGLSGMKDILE